MRKLVGNLALIAAVLWSVAVWGGYALIGWGSEVLAENVGLLVQPPELVPYAAWARFIIEGFGQGAAIVLWLLGLGMIGLAQLVAKLILGRVAPEPELPRVPPEQIQPAAAPVAQVWGRQASRR